MNMSHELIHSRDRRAGGWGLGGRSPPLFWRKLLIMESIWNFSCISDSNCFQLWGILSPWVSVGVSIIVSVSATGQKLIMLVSCSFGAKLMNTFSFDEIFIESCCCWMLRWCFLWDKKTIQSREKLSKRGRNTLQAVGGQSSNKRIMWENIFSSTTNKNMAKGKHDTEEILQPDTAKLPQKKKWRN